jgi:CTP-dependent riboflavin kinase
MTVSTPTPILVLSGTLRLSEPGAKRTVGRFNTLVTDNAAVFRSYFGVDLFPGSLNVDVSAPVSLQRDLDAGNPPPAFVIPKTELINMPAYIGDGQAWPCILRGEKFPAPVSCWILRRIGSRVAPGVIEIVAQDKLRDLYSLRHGDAITMELVARQTGSSLPEPPKSGRDT